MADLSASAACRTSAGVAGAPAGTVGIDGWVTDDDVSGMERRYPNGVPVGTSNGVRARTVPGSGSGLLDLGPATCAHGPGRPRSRVRRDGRLPCWSDSVQPAPYSVGPAPRK